MDFALTPEQEAIREAVGAVCTRFDDDYWLKKDKEGGFPHDFHRRAWRRPAGSASACPRSTAARGSASPRRR